MWRALLVLTVAFGACGGDGVDFDADAVRRQVEQTSAADATAAEIEAVVDSTRSICELDDQETRYAIAILGDDSGADAARSLVERMVLGCPDEVPDPG